MREKSLVIKQAQSGVNSKINILQVVGRLDGGGIQSFMLNVIKFCDKSRFQIDVCEMSCSPGSQVDYARQLGAGVFTCSLRKNPLTFKKRFAKIIKDGNYQCVHALRERYSAILVWIAKSLGVPVRIAHYQSTASHESVLTPLYSRIALNKATHIIGCSKSVLNHYFPGKLESDSRLQAIYNGMDYELFTSASQNRLKVREELGIAPDELTVGSCLRFSHVKNPQLFVELARKVNQQTPKVKFLLVGDGPLRNEVSDLIRKYNLEPHFICPGWQDDIARMMSAMDIYVVTSRLEGFCIALAEAQALGLPCVATNVECFYESLCPQMHNNLFSNNDPDEGAQLIVDLLLDNQNRTEMGQAGFEFVKKFDMREITRQIEAIYSAKN